MTKMYVKVKEVEKCGDCPNVTSPNGFYKCQETGVDVDISSIDANCPLQDKVEAGNLGLNVEVGYEVRG